MSVFVALHARANTSVYGVLSQLSAKIYCAVSCSVNETFVFVALVRPLVLGTHLDEKLRKNNFLKCVKLASQARGNAKSK